MGQYQFVTEKVLNQPNTPSDPAVSSSFGQAGDILLGVFIQYTDGDTLTMNVEVRFEDPDGTFRFAVDADLNRVGVHGITSTLNRWLWIGPDNASAFGLFPSGFIMPAPGQIRCDFTSGTPTSASSLEVWVVHGPSFG